MEPLPRKITINKVDTLGEISYYVDGDGRNFRDYPFLKIISIKIRDIEISDVLIDFLFIDSSLTQPPPQPPRTIRFYLSEYGEWFIKQDEFWVLYTSNIDIFKIPIPPETFKVKAKAMSLYKIPEGIDYLLEIRSHFSS